MKTKIFILTLLIASLFIGFNATAAEEGGSDSMTLSQEQINQRLTEIQNKQKELQANSEQDLPVSVNSLNTDTQKNINVVPVGGNQNLFSKFIPWISIANSLMIIVLLGLVLKQNRVK